MVRESKTAQDGKTQWAKMVYRPEFVRKVDKSKLKTCSILGSEILVSTMDELTEYLTSNIHALSGDYLTVSATNEIVMSLRDPDFYRCQNGGVLTIPDGGPLVTYGKKHGFSDMSRLTGPDLMVNMFRISEERGLRNYFYGSTKETLRKMKKRLMKEYPGLCIAGMQPSRFRDLTQEEDAETVKRINAARPDLVWFCLGAPKGNFFAARHQGIIRGLMISVGAAFDYYAGNISRAPLWMQEHDLEWLYRLKQEPGRLIKRYGYNIPSFLWHAYILKR